MLYQREAKAIPAPPTTRILRLNPKGKAKGEWRSRSPKPQALALKSGQTLIAGDQFRCLAGEIIYFSYGKKRKLTPAGGWKTILPPYISTDYERYLKAALPIGGSLKSKSSGLLSPRESESIIPERFALRWDRTHGKYTTVVASLRHRGKLLVPDFPLRWEDGSYRSEALTLALAEHQKSDARDPVELVLTLDGEVQNPVRFAVLPKVAMDAVLAEEKKLAKWDDPVAATLGRVMMYWEARLFSDVVEEYWKLHLLVPSRSDITQVVREVLKDAGDSERLSQLK